MRIAIHSGSASVSRTLRQIITASGHTVSSLAQGADLILVDQHNRASAPVLGTAPILALGQAHADEDQWLPCPMPPDRLIQKLTHWQQTRTTPFGNGWVLDNSSRQLSHATGTTLSLTEKECALLQQLLSAPAQTMNRDDLLEAVWGVGDSIDTHTLETHIYRLRSKFEGLIPSPGQITTTDGAYRWDTRS